MSTRMDYILAIQANTAALDKVQASLAAIGSTSARSFGAVQSHLAATQTRGEALAVTFGTLASAAIQKTAGALLDLGQESLGAAGNIEQMRVRFTNLLGSQQAANAEIQKLQQLANNSSFTLPGLVQAETRLLGVGQSAEQARTLLQAVGDTVAGVGGGTDEIQGVTLALAQMASKGKVSSEELNQLAERGVPALQILARALGTTNGEAQKLVETGHVSADTFIKAFETNAIERFSGAMAKQAGTWNGLISTAGDLKTTMEAAFGSGIVEALEPVLARVLADLQNPATVANLRAIGQEIGNVAGWLARAAEAEARLQGLLSETSPAQKQADAIQQQATAAGQAAKSALDGLAAIRYQGQALDSNRSKLTALSRAEADARSAARADVEGLRAKERSLEAQWRTTDRLAELEKARARLSKDRGAYAKDLALAGDIYSSVGQAARARLQDDRERITDDQGRIGEIQTALTRDRQKQALDDEIRRREAALDRTLAGLDRERRALEDSAAAQKAATGATAAHAGVIRGLNDYLSSIPAKLTPLFSALTQLDKIRAALGMLETPGGGAHDSRPPANTPQGMDAIPGPKAVLNTPWGPIGAGWDTRSGGGLVQKTVQDQISKPGSPLGDLLQRAQTVGQQRAVGAGGAAQSVTVNIQQTAQHSTEDLIQAVTNAIRKALPSGRR